MTDLQIRQNEPFKPPTTFKVGGPAPSFACAAGVRVSQQHCAGSAQQPAAGNYRDCGGIIVGSAEAAAALGAGPASGLWAASQDLPGDLGAGRAGGEGDARPLAICLGAMKWERGAAKNASERQTIRDGYSTVPGPSRGLNSPNIRLRARRKSRKVMPYSRMRPWASRRPRRVPGNRPEATGGV